MTTKYIFPVAMLALMIGASPVSAADDFGTNFTAQTPAALQDTAQDFSADEMSRIEPAAGQDLFALEGVDISDTPEASAQDIAEDHLQDLLDSPVRPGTISPVQ